MYKEIDNLIADARKGGYKSTLKVLQLIKSEFQKFETSSKNNKLDEIQEAKILLKMKDQWVEELNTQKAANRDTTELLSDLQILIGYIPELPSEEEVEERTNMSIEIYSEEHPNLSMKDMKTIMNMVKERYPLADSSIIARTFKEYLSK